MSRKRSLAHSSLQILGWSFSHVCSFDLEVICKRSKKEGRIFDLYEFWSEEVYCNKTPKQKTLMFEHYNLVDSKEKWGCNFLRLIYRKVV
jgi:hypothetical protein